MYHFRIRELRDAVRDNRISFPAQAPLFVKQSRAGIQRRVVVLYVIRGWSCADIGSTVPSYLAADRTNGKRLDRTSNARIYRGYFARSRIAHRNLDTIYIS